MECFNLVVWLNVWISLTIILEKPFLWNVLTPLGCLVGCLDHFDHHFREAVKILTPLQLPTCHGFSGNLNGSNGIILHRGKPELQDFHHLLACQFALVSFRGFINLSSNKKLSLWPQLSPAGAWGFLSTVEKALNISTADSWW